MHYNLSLFTRLLGNGSFQGNITHIARKWRRSIRAIGGYWLGSFEISEDDMPWYKMCDFYDNNLGCRIVEDAYGITTWEGLLYEFRLVKDGQEYRRTLDPEWFHNRVKTVYSYPSASDTNQGALTYNPVANSFQDAAQDFGEWETLAGNATYSLTVTNADGTIGWGFLGAAFTTGGADDSIYVYTDLELATAGWNGEVGGKTPSTYDVRNIELSGARQETTWDENTDSSGIYGQMDYIVSMGGATPPEAEAARDLHLSEYAWPRSRKIGGGGRKERKSPAVLEVSVAGYWTTLNWIYREVSRTAAPSDMIATLVAASEFITAGRIETNTSLSVKSDCDPIPQRIGDLIEKVTQKGDRSQNLWACGVYADRKLIYEQAPNAVEYYVRNDGKLIDKASTQAIPAMMRAGFLLQDERAPTGGQPPGASSVWDNPQIGYVEEIEFRGDNNTLRYKIFGEEESVAVLMDQLWG